MFVKLGYAASFEFIPQNQRLQSSLLDRNKLALGITIPQIKVINSHLLIVCHEQRINSATDSKLQMKYKIPT